MKNIFLLIFISFASLFIESCGNKKSLTSVSDSVDYNIHIRPILSDRCFKCHGPDARQRKANLRLDTPEGAYSALKDDSTKHVIVPGHSDLSEVFLKISTADTSEVMPPPNSNLSLNQNEISLIKKWIDQGAKYKPHWAFIPPKKSELPEVEDEKWPKNEIDRFILARLEQEEIEPNDEADKERLLKRVCFDITGLPPSIDLQEKFLKDDSKEAYEKVVDELFAIPQYG